MEPFMIELDVLDKDRFGENCTPSTIYTVNWLIKGKSYGSKGYYIRIKEYEKVSRTLYSEPYMYLSSPALPERLYQNRP